MKLPAPTILIGEGDPFSLNVLDEASRGAGFDVVAAITGAEVLEHVARRPPVLALLSVGLHDPNGFEVLRVLKQDDVLDSIPVVIAIDNAEQRARAMELGAEGVVERPYVLRTVQTQVLEALRVARDRRRKRRESIPLIPQQATDEETGCGTRAQLLLTLDYEITRAERFQHPLTCVVVAFENAASAPTELLRRLAEELSASLRAMDAIFRLDQSRFAVVLPETNAEGAEVVCQRLGSRFGQPPWREYQLRLAQLTIPSPRYLLVDEFLAATQKRLQPIATDPNS